MKNENHDAREWKFMKHGKEIHEGRNGISNMRERERERERDNVPAYLLPLQREKYI